MRVAAILILATFGLSGCATNAIRLDRAETMTKAGREATGQTRALMDDVRKENRELLIDLIASDPACVVGVDTNPVIAFRKPERGPTQLCRKGGVKSDGDFVIRRLIREDFAPSLAVIDGLVAYLTAVDAIITRDPIDLEATVSEAYGEIQGIAADIKAISGSKLAIPELSQPQQEALGSVLSLLSEILDEAKRVGDLRTLENGKDARYFSESHGRLADINERWLRSLRGELRSQRTLLAERLAATRAYQYEKRRALATDQLRLIERTEQIEPLGRALAKTVMALQEAHTDYRSLLFGTSKQLTREEKRKAARITRIRLRAALSSLAKIVTAF